MSESTRTESVEAATGSADQAPAKIELSLRRIEPSIGRGEVISLGGDVGSITIGRAETNSIRLYSATASRHHAELARQSSGRWLLSSQPGCTISIDDYPIAEAVDLELGMNLQMGGDQLRCEHAPELEGENGERESRDVGSKRFWNLGGAIRHFLKRKR